MMKAPMSCVPMIALATLVLSSAAIAAGEMPAPLQPEDIKWGDAPPSFPKGAKMAVLSGDPAATGGFVTLRLKLPAGYKVAPHWHPTDEHVTIISGSMALGMGDTMDKTKAKTLKAGGYAVAPANMHHFAMTKTGATIEISLIGPVGITYVNPADDPSKAK